MIRFVIGLFILLGAVGREDFYLECVQADCVADAPNFGVSLMLAVLGLAFMAWKTLCLLSTRNLRRNKYI